MYICSLLNYKFEKLTLPDTESLTASLEQTLLSHGVFFYKLSAGFIGFGVFVETFSCL